MNYKNFLNLKSIFISLFVLTIFPVKIISYPTSEKDFLLKVRLFSLLKLKELSFKREKPFQVIINSNHTVNISTNTNFIKFIFSNDRIEVINKHNNIYNGYWNSINIVSTSEDPVLVGNKLIPLRPYSGNFLILNNKHKAMKPITSQELRVHFPESPICINIVSLNKYLASVIHAEIWGVGNSIETLKAQAVVSRSYIFAKLNRHKNHKYNFCDTTHCQVYLGAKNIDNSIIKAVSDTSNQVLTYNNNIIPTYFHSTCGGHTSTPKDIWQNKNIKYYLGVKDTDKNNESYCQNSPHYYWKSKIDKKQISSIFLNKETDYESINFYDWKHDSANRVIQFTLSSKTRSIKLMGEDFRIRIGRHLGWNKIKSLIFTIKSDKNAIYFRGRGLGHGIGFCQYGAAKMGSIGKDYLSILKHYFPKCNVSIK